MNYMPIDDAMEEEATNKSEISVHRCNRAFHKSPCFSLKLGYFWMSVMEIRYSHDPVVDPQIWLQVQKHCES